MNDSSPGRLVGALVSPVATFRSITARPTWVLALLTLVVLPLVPAFLALPKFDWEAMADRQLEQMDQEPEPGQREQMVTMMEKLGPIGTYLSPLLMTVMFLVVTAALWGGLNMIGGKVDFKTAWSVTLHAMMPLAVVALLSIPVILSLDSVGPDDIRGDSYLASSAAAFAPEGTHPVLLAVLSSLDVFTIWTLALLVVGFSIAAGVGRGSAVGVVGALWLLWVLLKAGFAALGMMFGGGGGG